MVKLNPQTSKDVEYYLKRAAFIDGLIPAAHRQGYPQATISKMDVTGTEEMSIQDAREHWQRVAERAGLQPDDIDFWEEVSGWTRFIESEEIREIVLFRCGFCGGEKKRWKSICYEFSISQPTAAKYFNDGLKQILVGLYREKQNKR